MLPALPASPEGLSLKGCDRWCLKQQHSCLPMIRKMLSSIHHLGRHTTMSASPLCRKEETVYLRAAVTAALHRAHLAASLRGSMVCPVAVPSTLESELRGHCLALHAVFFVRRSSLVSRRSQTGNFRTCEIRFTRNGLFEGRFTSIENAAGRLFQHSGKSWRSAQAVRSVREWSIVPLRLLTYACFSGVIRLVKGVARPDWLYLPCVTLRQPVRKRKK